MRRFSASMDDLAKTITFVVCIVLVVPFFVIFNQYRQSHQALMWLGPVVVVLALVTAALFRPKEYTLDSEGLNIVRPIKPIMIPLHSINSVMPVTSKELGFGIRTFGSGGFFGYFGKFYYRNHGTITLYATDRSKMLLITLTNDRKIIISPDDPSGFLTAFNDLKHK